MFLVIIIKESCPKESLSSPSKCVVYLSHSCWKRIKIIYNSCGKEEFPVFERAKYMCSFVFVSHWSQYFVL